MTNLPEIASLWIGPELSFLEQLCLKSFVDQGHLTTLYVYENVGHVPAGVVVKDASEIYRGAPFRVHRQHGSPAIHADFFRLALMKRGRGEIWADTDAYCYKPFDFSQDHVFGHFDDEIANGVLRLPPESAALRAYDAFLENDAPIAPFLPKPMQIEIARRREMGEKIPIEAMPWGVSGPKALTYFLAQTGEISWAQAEKVFYPMTWPTRRRFLMRPQKFMEITDDNTVSFHFLGRIVRRILSQEFGGLPKAGSILDKLCKEHGIDPMLAPIPLKT